MRGAALAAGRLWRVEIRAAGSRAAPCGLRARACAAGDHTAAQPPPHRPCHAPPCRGGAAGPARTAWRRGGGFAGLHSAAPGPAGAAAAVARVAARPGSVQAGGLGGVQPARLGRRPAAAHRCSAQRHRPHTAGSLCGPARHAAHHHRANGPTAGNRRHAASGVDPDGRHQRGAATRRIPASQRPRRGCHCGRRAGGPAGQDINQGARGRTVCRQRHAELRAVRTCARDRL